MRQPLYFKDLWFCKCPGMIQTGRQVIPTMALTEKLLIKVEKPVGKYLARALELGH